MRAVVSQYFFPILSGDLIVTVAVGHREHILDAGSVFKIVSGSDLPDKDTVVRPKERNNPKGPPQQVPVHNRTQFHDSRDEFALRTIRAFAIGIGGEVGERHASLFFDFMGRFLFKCVKTHSIFHGG